MTKGPKYPWRHPIHTRGLRSANFSSVHVTGDLTDRKIDKYRQSGFYEMRAHYLKEKKQRLAEKRMFYDLEKQDFVWL